MEPQEYNRTDDPFPPYVDHTELIFQKLKVSVTFDQISIKDFSVPTERQMVRIFNQIDMIINWKKDLWIRRELLE